MTTATNFDPAPIEEVINLLETLDSMGAYKDVIRGLIKEGIRLVHDSVKRYEKNGGWHFTQEWLPYMSSILENLKNYLIQLQSEDQSYLTHDNLLAMVSVVREIRCIVVEKNTRLEAQIDLIGSLKKAPFEPLDCEFYRKIGEIFQLSRLCTYLDEISGSPQYLAARRRREKNLISFIVMGKRYSAGTFRDSDLIFLLPPISEEKTNLLLQFAQKLEAMGRNIDARQIITVHVQQDGLKMMDEILIMARYLEGQNYSRQWRMSIALKIQELRQVVEDGGQGREMREALQYVNHNYHRIRACYDKKKARENPAAFERRNTAILH